ncbi:hypothetical protein RHS04_06738 [Rhizoctonia solani]|uniref:Uncharacterized protein n=1 Tax=Rhizoctonia solani TaxID=456999 RepID=A0A8H7H510_9AGAM|nr:hypothetical protein RHS04_06738 [Rhizoctonia solani]
MSTPAYEVHIYGSKKSAKPIRKWVLPELLRAQFVNTDTGPKCPLEPFVNAFWSWVVEDGVCDVVRPSNPVSGECVLYKKAKGPRRHLAVLAMVEVQNGQGRWQRIQPQVGKMIQMYPDIAIQFQGKSADTTFQNANLNNMEVDNGTLSNSRSESFIDIASTQSTTPSMRSATTQPQAQPQEPADTSNPLIALIWVSSKFFDINNLRPTCSQIEELGFFLQLCDLPKTQAEYDLLYSKLSSSPFPMLSYPEVEKLRLLGRCWRRSDAETKRYLGLYRWPVEGSEKLHSILSQLRELD